MTKCVIEEKEYFEVEIDGNLYGCRTDYGIFSYKYIKNEQYLTLFIRKIKSEKFLWWFYTTTEWEYQTHFIIDWGFTTIIKNRRFADPLKIKQYVIKAIDRYNDEQIKNENENIRYNSIKHCNKIK